MFFFNVNSVIAQIKVVLPNHVILLYVNIYFIIYFACLRYLSENKIDALPDKIFKGVKSLKALWVQLNSYKHILEYLNWWNEYNKRSNYEILVYKFNMM